MPAVTAPVASDPVSLQPDDVSLGLATMRRVSLRLLPFLFLLYICNYLDRTNVSIAALQMNRDLHFSSSAFGLGAGVFFIGYSLFEVPSNLLLVRVGARKWIARIMISWGILAAGMMFVRTPLQFYSLRFLLGVAEAGFFPGIIYFLSKWFPAAQRASATARFMIAVPLSTALGGPMGGLLLGLNGRGGLAGWQWLFVLEGIPSVVLGVAVLSVLCDRPEDVQWLSPEQRAWLATRLERDDAESAAPHRASTLRALMSPTLWLLTVPWFIMLTASYGYAFWAPTVIRDALHSSNAMTGAIVGLFAVLAAIFGLLMGANADRTGEPALHSAIGAIIIAAGYAGAALMPTPILRIASFALVTIGVSSFHPGFWCLPGMLLRGTSAAAGIAFVNAVGNIGGFVGPTVIGFVKDATGATKGAFLAFAVLPLIAAAVLLLVRRRAVFAVRPREESVSGTVQEVLS